MVGYTAARPFEKDDKVCRERTREQRGGGKGNGGLIRRRENLESETRSGAKFYPTMWTTE